MWARPRSLRLPSVGFADHGSVSGCSQKNKRVDGVSELTRQQLHNLCVSLNGVVQAALRVGPPYWDLPAEDAEDEDVVRSKVQVRGSSINSGASSGAGILWAAPAVGSQWATPGPRFLVGPAALQTAPGQAFPHDIFAHQMLACRCWGFQDAARTLQAAAALVVELLTERGNEPPPEQLRVIAQQLHEVLLVSRAL